MKMKKKGMACIRWNGKTGNPCIFGQKYYEELMEISGDKGGKKIIKKHPEDVAYLQIRNARELQDADEPVCFYSRKPAIKMISGIVIIDRTVVNENISEA